MAYNYQIGIIRARETALLEKSDWNRLLYIPTLKDTWAELVRLDLGFYEVGELEMLKSISDVYSQNIENLYKEISNYFMEEDQDIKNSFLYEFDIYNLKLIYKQKSFSEGNFSCKDKLLNIGLFKGDDILKYLNNELWLDVKFDKFFEEILDILKSENVDMTPFDFDVFVDEKLFNFRVKTAEKHKNQFLLKIWKMKIDFYNLKLFVGKNKKFIDNGNICGKDWDSFRVMNNEEVLENLDFLGYKNIGQVAFLGDAADWELKEENKILQVCEEGIMFFETLEPIIAYFFKRYFEIKNLNRLLYGRAFRLPNSQIENQISGI